MLWRQVRLAARVLAVQFQDQLLRVREVNARNLRRDHRQLDLEQRQFGRVDRLQMFDDAADDPGQDRHHVPMVADEAHLRVQADVLVDVAHRIVRLGPEDRSHLEHALENAHHDLLVELRALRQIGLAVEVLHPKDVGPALGGRLHQLRRLDLGEAQPSSGLRESRP